MTRFFLLLLSSYLLALFQSGVMGEIFPPGWKPDLMLILITHLGASSSLVAGALLVSFCGFLYDTFSGSPFGLFLLVYLSLFFMVKLLLKFLILSERYAFRTALVALALIVQAFGLASLPGALGITAGVVHPEIPWILSQILMTCVFCWPLLYLLQKLDPYPGAEFSPPEA